MQYKFLGQPTGGIKIIDELAVERLCQLEGSNGIGKTLAVRLLELATGGQPYATMPGAWKSLRRHLGPLRILVSGLHDGDKLDIELTPSFWTEEPLLGPTELGIARLNGEPVAFQSIPDILRVIRVGGDEDITSQFEQIIAEDASRVERQNDRMSKTIDLLGRVCDQLLNDIKDLSPQMLDELMEQQTLATQHRASVSQEYEQQIETVRKLEQLDHQVWMLTGLQEQGSSIEAELARADIALKELAQVRAGLEERRRQLLPNAEREQLLIAELERLRLEREQRAGDAKVAAAKLKDALAQLKLPDETAIPVAQTQAKVQREELERSRVILLVPPDLTALIGRLRDSLDEVRGSRLDDEVVVSLDRESVTVRELRAGLIRREREVAEQQQRTLLEEIEARIRLAERSIQELREAAKLQADVKRKKESLFTTEAKLREVAAALDRGHNDQYQQVVEKLQQVQEQELDWTAQRATLRYRKSVLEREGTADVLEASVTALKTELGVLSAPASALEEAQARVASCRVRLQAADEEQRRATGVLKEFERKLDRTVILLEQNADYEWLRATMADQLPSTRDAPRAALERIAQLDRAVRSFQRATDILGERTARVLDALRLLVPRQRKPAQNAYLRPLADYYERRFGTLLADKELQTVLFEGGRFSRLDLLNWEVSWESADGEPQRRPIEAFSSGERAFAYVLASILRHGDIKARNRLLVLDEFGAFIEAGRLDQLRRFLRDQVLYVGRADQVIIILPLHQARDNAELENGDEQARAAINRGYSMTEISLEAME